MIRRLLLACVIVGALYAFHSHHSHAFNWAYNWHAREASASAMSGASASATNSDREQTMIDRHFSAQPGGTLEVRVGDANVVVETGNASEAQVTVNLRGRDMDRARRYFEALHFQVEQSGNTIRVTTNEGRNGHFSFNNDGGAEITVHARVPRQFNAALATSDGNVSLGSLQGTVSVATSDGNISAADLKGATLTLKTSDGNISTGSVEGESISLVTSDGNIHAENGTAKTIALRTSDGNITADHLRGQVDAATSDGNIQFGQIDGAEVTLRSSDGDIVADALSAGSAEVHTSDGNIRLENVDGPLQARTSSGEIQVSLLKPAEVHLRTEDGNIQISAPNALPANLRLNGQEVHVATEMGFHGTLKPDEVEGSVNGGGPTLEAYTASGSVFLGSR